MTNEKVYAVVIDKILKLLEEGKNPWEKPWKSAFSAPRNLKSGKLYRGANAFILGFLGGYDNPFWVTFKQCQEAGGRIKKGEHGLPIIFYGYMRITKDGKRISDNTWEKLSPAEQKGITSYPIARYYKVWNIEQCEGVQSKKLDDWEKAKETHFKNWDPIKGAEAVYHKIEDMVEVRFGGSRAFYSPSQDYIQLPKRETFEAPEGFYSTAYHEGGHSTGAPHRLDRKEGMATLGQEKADYAFEELVAEMTSAFLCAAVGIGTKEIENQASYLKGWLKPLKENPDWIIKASARAQEAVEFIQAVKPKVEPKAETKPKKETKQKPVKEPKVAKTTKGETKTKKTAGELLAELEEQEAKEKKSKKKKV